MFSSLIGQISQITVLSLKLEENESALKFKFERSGPGTLDMDAQNAEN